MTYQDTTTHNPAAIEDFGEKIGGARKDMGFQSRCTGAVFSSLYGEPYELLNNADFWDTPFSKIWPIKEIKDIKDIDVAAAVMALRTVLGSRPARNALPSKRYNWVRNFCDFRQYEKMIVNEGIFPESYDCRNINPVEMCKPCQMLSFIFKGIDRKYWGLVDTSDIFRDMLRVNGHQVCLRTTAQSALECAKKALTQAPGKVTLTKFRLHSFNRADTKYWFQAQSDRMETRLMTFDSKEKAWDFYKNGGKDKLASLWEIHKSRNAVHKTDVRNKENRIRKGIDWRQGKDITPDEFINTFGFRGVEFGLWVGKKNLERQAAINHAYDALLDLAGVINAEPRALSLNGRLALAFGARGSGKFSAHYEPGLVVINLTKTRGAGSLAHEWFHAFDNYMGQHKTEICREYASAIVTKNETCCKLSIAFARLRAALLFTPMYKRAEKMDEIKSGADYWSTDIEMAARAFENYVIIKMAEELRHNDYLANVTPFKEFDKNPDLYPYLLDEEMPNVTRAFDEIFQLWDVAPFDRDTAAIKPSESVEIAGTVESAEPIEPTEATTEPTEPTEATEATTEPETAQPALGHESTTIALAEAVLQAARESLGKAREAVKKATQALELAKAAVLGLPADEAEASEGTDSSASDTMAGGSAPNLQLGYEPALLLAYYPTPSVADDDSPADDSEPEPKPTHATPKRKKAGRPRKNPLAAFTDADLIKELLSRGYDVTSHIANSPPETAQHAMIH